jgi:hypothetical protein
MSKKILFSMLGFLLVVGGFWAGQAQDPPQTPRTDAPAVAATTQTDLSGTYAGTFNCEALGLTGDTTLTITGNEFTTADGKTGRIVASTTGGYTAVAMQVGGAPAATPVAAPTATAAPTIVSLRARKTGNRLTLMAVPGAAQKCTFTTSRVARGRRGQQTPAATGTEVAAPATATPTESPMPAQTPAPSPTPMPSPTQMPTPEPMPSPSPSASPTPMPSPGEPTPSPSPGPSPEPSPTASPTPTPSPSPRLR